VRKGGEFCVWIRNSHGHQLNAVLDVGELGVEVFTSKI
jgi:hypothetical protein